MAKKILYEGPNVKIDFTLHSDSTLKLQNKKVREFIDKLITLDIVSGNSIKKFEVLNGLPIYEYTMTRTDNKVWYQEVRINDGDFNVACHKFDVPDFWCNKIIEVYFELRRMSTVLIYENHITSIKVTWS